MSKNTETVLREVRAAVEESEDFVRRKPARQVGLTQEQLEMRRHGVGGSEVAAILGLSPFARPIDVWLAKVEGVQTDVTEHMERGLYLEAGMADWYAMRTGSDLSEVGTLQHPSFSRVICTPDRIASKDGEQIDLSIKVPWFTGEEWGMPGTDEVPTPYLIQIQWELFVLEELFGIKRAHLAAPIKGKLAIYEFESDRGIQEELAKQVNVWWARHIDTKTPPPVDASESYSDYLKSKFPIDNGAMKVANDDFEQHAARYDALKTQSNALEAEREAEYNWLRQYIGETSGAAGAGWTATLKKTKDSEKTDFEAIVRELGASADLIQKHTRKVLGHRRLLVKPTKKKER